MKIRQRGITAIETVGALALGSIMLIGLTKMIDTSMDDLKGQQTAHYHAQVVAAARAYIKAEYKDLKDKTYDPPIIVEVPLATLKAENFLPESFSLTNNYGQQTCILVRQPAKESGKLDALVVTWGGQKIGDKDIAAIAAKAGKGSGYITSAAPTVARGSSWSMATDAYRGKACVNGGPQVLTGTDDDGGHLVSNLFYDGPGQLATDFLHRHRVPGQDELNKMLTPILFNKLDDPYEKGAVDRIEDDASDHCGYHAAIAFNSSRELMTCETDGKWRRVSRVGRPVENYGALPMTAVPGDMRLTLDTNRMFVYNGSAWVAVAVDQNGNLNVTENLTARNIAAANNITAANISATNNISAANNITAARNIEATGQVTGGQIYGRYVVMTPEVALSGIRTAGEECHIPAPNGAPEIWYAMGTILSDAWGISLVCSAHTAAHAAAGVPRPTSGFMWTYQNGKLTPG